MSSDVSVKIFGTPGSQELTQGIYDKLRDRITILPGQSKISEFDNENLEAAVDNVRGQFVVVVDTHVSPVNTRLMGLFALLDAIRNASPADILLVFAYMDYCRSDRKDKPRISTMAKFIAHAVNNVCGVKKVLLLDPHSEYTKEYLEPTADEISAKYLWMDYLEREVFSTKSKDDCVIVFSDNGSAKRYRDVPGLLKLRYAYLDKGERDEHGSPEIKGVVGEVKNKLCIIIDDEILGGGTLISASKKLLEEGASSVYALTVHPILSKKGMSSTEVVQRLEASPIEKIITTNSVPAGDKLKGSSKFQIISVTGLLAETIERTVLNKSLTELYKLDKVNLYR